MLCQGIVCITFDACNNVCMLFNCYMTDKIVDLFTLVLSTSAHVKTKPLSPNKD